MGRSYSRRISLSLALGGLLFLCGCGAGDSANNEGTANSEDPQKEFTIGWAIYAGYMPWPYAEKAGIVKKWADKYGIKIKIVQVNDYVESLNQYTAGKLDGVAATTMDALAVPAAGGKDTTVLLIGDYSNGNDGIVLKNGQTMADIKGRTVNLVELSISHYMLARALELSGMKLFDIKTVNTSDADIVGSFASPDVTAVAAWNPQFSELRQSPGATMVFDSTKIPNELLDVLNVDTKTLKANPNLGKALAGIWYETMAILSKNDAKAKEARAIMARDSGTTLASFEGQLKTTYFYTTPKEAVAYTMSPGIITVTDRIRQFSFANGLFGPTATNVDAIGIAFPGGKTLGNKANVKLRFDPTFMQMAADGKL